MLYQYDWESTGTLSRCESPIEKKLLSSWLDRIQSEWSSEIVGDGRKFILGKDLSLWEAAPEEQVMTISHARQVDIVYPQAVLGEYRVDFIFCRLGMISRDAEPHHLLKKIPPLVVECDGHDFHEKTKEQAQRDKSRDRALVAMGYRVLRFTGSEITRDPWRCADEIDALLKCLLNPKLIEATREPE